MHICKCYRLEQVPVKSQLDDVLFLQLDIVQTPSWRYSVGGNTCPRMFTDLAAAAALAIAISRRMSNTCGATLLLPSPSFGPDRLAIRHIRES